MALVAVGMGLNAGEHDAQRLLVAVRLVQRVAPVLAPARLPVVAAQHCDRTEYLGGSSTRRSPSSLLLHSTVNNNQS